MYATAGDDLFEHSGPPKSTPGPIHADPQAYSSWDHRLGSLPWHPSSTTPHHDPSSGHHERHHERSGQHGHYHELAGPHEHHPDPPGHAYHNLLGDHPDPYDRHGPESGHHDPPGQQEQGLESGPQFRPHPPSSSPIRPSFPSPRKPRAVVPAGPNIYHESRQYVIDKIGHSAAVHPHPNPTLPAPSSVRLRLPLPSRTIHTLQTRPYTKHPPMPQIMPHPTPQTTPHTKLPSVPPTRPQIMQHTILLSMSMPHPTPQPRTPCHQSTLTYCSG